MIPDTTLFLANADALDTTLAAWKQAQPAAGVLCLLPESEQALVPRVQAACRNAGLPLAGAIFPALIVDEAFVRSGLLLMRFDRCPDWFLLDEMGGDPAGAARRIAAACGPIEHECAEKPTLFLIFDGLIDNIGSMLNKLFGELKTRVRYAGVNAGSETFTPLPCLFDSERLIDRGVLGIVSREPRQVVVRHGYPVSKTLLKATSMSGNRINSIDGRPPFEVYQEVIRNEYGIALTRENFYDYAVHYPFGEIAALNVLVRIPVGFDADGCLYCIGEIPDNSLLRLLQAPELADSNCVRLIAEALPVSPGQALMLFYCAGRCLHLGDNAPLELTQLKAATRAAGLFGALSLGEIDTDETLGIPQFHNAALVCCQR